MELKKYRKEKDLTQQEVAKILNVAPTTYLGYEKETSEPSIETLCRLADYYEIPLDHLVGRKFNDGTNYLTDQQRLAVNIIKQLNDINLTKAIAYMSGMQAVQ